MMRLSRKKKLIFKGAKNSSKKNYNHTNYIIRKSPTGLNPNPNPNPNLTLKYEKMLRKEMFPHFLT